MPSNFTTSIHTQFAIAFCLFRGIPVAYHGKNLVGFVFLCRDKLQSYPIGLRRIFIVFFSVGKLTNRTVQNVYRFFIDLPIEVLYTH